MKKHLKTFSILALLVIIPGCLSWQQHNVGIEPEARVIENRQYRILGESEGQSSSFNLFWLIPVTPRVSYEDAVNDAISNLGGDNLIEVRTWMERQYWIVGMVSILHVKGKVILYKR